MLRIPVTSTAIDAIGYDPITRTLEVAWKARKGVRAIWQYAPITQDEYDALLEPEASVGKFVSGLRMRSDCDAVHVVDEIVEAAS